MLAWCTDHWFLGFILGLCVLGTAYSIVANIAEVILEIVKQSFRTLKIRKAGWPPPHIDADGDFRKK